MTEKVSVRFRVVDELPHDAPCALVGEPDDLTYLLARGHDVDAYAASLQRLFDRLVNDVGYSAEAPQERLA